MALYFDELYQDLVILSERELARVALEEFGINPNDFQTPQEIADACVSVEQYAAYS